MTINTESLSPLQTQKHTTVTFNTDIGIPASSTEIYQYDYQHRHRYLRVQYRNIPVWPLTQTSASPHPALKHIIMTLNTGSIIPAIKTETYKSWSSTRNQYSRFRNWNRPVFLSTQNQYPASNTVTHQYGYQHRPSIPASSTETYQYDHQHRIRIPVSSIETYQHGYQCNSNSNTDIGNISAWLSIQTAMCNVTWQLNTHCYPTDKKGNEKWSNDVTCVTRDTNQIWSAYDNYHLTYKSIKGR